MSKDVMIVTGAGQISMAIARRVGFGKKIVLGDKNPKRISAADSYETERITELEKGAYSSWQKF